MKKCDWYLWPAFIVLVLFLTFVIHNLLSLPTVYYSTTTHKCVMVESETGEFDCTNLPERYHTTWVK